MISKDIDRENKRLKIYLFFCVAAFFALSLLILFYSFGYKYDIKYRRTIQTGSIFIGAYQKNIDIYINDKPIKNKKVKDKLFSNYTEMEIDGLEPGKYNIKIKKENHFGWEKNIEVKSGQVAKLENILLPKINYKKNVLLHSIETNPASRRNIWISNKKDKIIYKKTNEGRLSLFVFDLKSKKERIIFGTDNLQPEKAKSNYNFDKIIWSQNDKMIILKTINENSWFLIDIDKNNVYDLTHLFGKNYKIRSGWNFHIGKSLFYLKNNNVYKFDYSKQDSKKILENITAFLVENEHIYYFRNGDNNLRYTDYNKLSNSKSVFLMPDDFNASPVSKIIKSSKNTYLVLSGHKKLYFIDENRKVTAINSNVDNAYFSNNDNRIVYNNDLEIWIYYIKEKTSQPYKEKSANELIARYSKKLSNITLYKDEEHLFFKNGKVLRFIELDNRDRTNVFDILETENDDIFYIENDDSLVYRENNKLIRISLIYE